jgi:hypothetical protein
MLNQATGNEYGFDIRQVLNKGEQSPGNELRTDTQKNKTSDEQSSGNGLGFYDAMESGHVYIEIDFGKKGEYRGVQSLMAPNPVNHRSRIIHNLNKADAAIQPMDTHTLHSQDTSLLAPRQKGVLKTSRKPKWREIELSVGLGLSLGISAFALNTGSAPLAVLAVITAIVSLLHYAE